MTKRTKNAVAAIAAAMLLALPVGAGAQKADPTISYAADDERMNNARAEAVRTLPQFFARLNAPQSGDRDFELKFDLDPSDEGAEFIWSDNIRIDSSGAISATLANNPHLQGYRLGQRVDVRRDRIVDWGYRRADGVMQGHHTTRVILMDLEPSMAAQIRQSLGW